MGMHEFSSQGGRRLSAWVRFHGERRIDWVHCGSHGGRLEEIGRPCGGLVGFTMA